MVVLNHNLLRFAGIQIARCSTKTDYSDGLLESSGASGWVNLVRAGSLRSDPFQQHRSRLILPAFPSSQFSFGDLHQREKLYNRISPSGTLKQRPRPTRCGRKPTHTTTFRPAIWAASTSVDYDKSLPAAQETMKLDPGSGLSYANLVGSYLQVNRLDVARVGHRRRKPTIWIILKFLNLYEIDFLQHDARNEA